MQHLTEVDKQKHIFFNDVSFTKSEGKKVKEREIIFTEEENILLEEEKELVACLDFRDAHTILHTTDRGRLPATYNC